MANVNLSRYRELLAELGEQLDQMERAQREDGAGNPAESASNGDIAARKFEETLQALTNGQAEFAGAGMSVHASQREQEALQRSRGASPTRRELNSDDIEDGIMRFNTSGQPRGYGRADAALRGMETMLQRMSRQPTAEERNQLAAARHRADAIYSALGRAVPETMPGESPVAYRQRLASGLKDLSPKCGRINMDALVGGPLEVVEDTIYSDAMQSVRDGRAIPAGELRPHSYRGQTGHDITEYYGDSMGWMAPFMAPGARLTINRHPEGSSR